MELVLKAFNAGNTASQTKLEIESITVSTKNISIKGSTRKGAYTRQFRKAFDRVGLRIEQENLSSDKGRDGFTVIVAKK